MVLYKQLLTGNHYMNVSTDKTAIDEVTSRSIAEILPNKKAFSEALSTGKQLTFYVGIDPTADYVHLGHSTNYLILERLHKMGHRIIVLVGDFTAAIGDPSDKTSMRVQLTKEEIEENLATFKDQIGKILDFETKENPIEFRFNSEWLSSLTFKDSVELASNFTVQQMLERDAFKKRVEQQKPLYIHEFFYPLMQGFDSVAMDVDAEIGGTDQTFNMLAGRTLLKRYKNKEKFVITTTLLENPETGEKLMSKSLGTGVGLNEPPKSMFIKIMQLPDAGVMQCFIDCTRMPLDQIDSIKKELDRGTNPRDIKLRLAHEIVTMYHGNELADKAREDWIAEVSEKKLSDNIPTLKVDANTDLVSAIASLDVAGSNSAIRRLVEQGAIRVNDQKITVEQLHDITLSEGDIVAIGKRHTVKIELRK